MRKFITSVAILTIIVFSLKIQGQTVVIPDQTAQNCQIVSFAVTASGFPTNMAAASLFIPLDTTVLDFVSAVPGTLGGALVALSPQLILGITWSSAGGPVNINGTLVTLNFLYRGGTTNLNVLEGDFTTVLLQSVFPTYDNGSVSPLPLLTYHVDGAVVASGDGLSWGTALKKISEAANKPLKGGETVLIKPGTYNDTLVVKSIGTEIVPLTFNVTVSDSNKITFPASADLNCIDLAGYPGKYYAYVFRSWKGNNGVYKITSVNKTSKFVLVEGTPFVYETGAVGDSSLLQASIGFPVIYQKSANNPVTERVILSSTGITGERAAMHIGKPTAAGDFNVNAANYNILDGIDVTGADQVGVRIQNSKFNVIQNAKVYELDSIAFLISGNTSKPANNNIIINNTVYNTSRKALKVGIQSETSANNRANLNLFKNNDVTSTTMGSFINYINAVEVCRFTGYTVIEGNTFRSFSLKNINRGAIQIRNNVRRVLAYGNFIKNIGRVNAGTHGIFYLDSLGNNNRVYNNVIVDSLATDNDMFAFWANGNGGYTAGLIGYNTVHRVDNGFRLKSGSTSVDFIIKNNIMNLDATAPDIFNITGTGLFNVSYNCYNNLPAAYGTETGRLIADPLFLYTTTFNTPYAVSLQASSPCLSTGNPITGITTDLRRRNRNASTPSRGAIESPVTDAYWTGEVGTGWNNFRNWDVKIVPLATWDVIIPNRANDPLIGSGNVTVRTLNLRQGATLQINSPRILTVTN
jgi:hypothetical protein